MNNSTVNDSHLGEENNLYQPPWYIVCILSVVYGGVSLLAVCGNGFVIFVICRNKHMQTVTNLFIMNLSISDIVLGLFSVPFQFQAALLQRWVMPDFLCILSPFCKEFSVFVSVFTLTAIAIDRYFAFIHPLRHMLWTKNFAKLIILLIWSLSFIISFPMLLSYKVEKAPNGPRRCMEENWSSYWITKMVLQYVIPLIVIVSAYSIISYVIWGTKTPGYSLTKRDENVMKNKKKLIKMLVAVVLLFCLSWLPIQILNVLLRTSEDVRNYKYVNIVWFCCNWLAMSNACQNPFVYALLNDKFKRAFHWYSYRLVTLCCCENPKETDLQAKHSIYSDYLYSVRNRTINSTVRKDMVGGGTKGRRTRQVKSLHSQQNVDIKRSRFQKTKSLQDDNCYHHELSKIEETLAPMSAAVNRAKSQSIELGQIDEELQPMTTVEINKTATVCDSPELNGKDFITADI